jgi:hypothetical protein
VRLRGNNVYCPCCKKTASRFIRKDYCAFCDSQSRQRFLWLFLENLIREGDSLLHFAPEESLAARLRNLRGVKYLSADISSVFADVHVNLASEADVVRRLGAGAYTVVIISHVLEHIPDDIAAMRSLNSLIDWNGYVLIQVPLDPNRPETYEDWAITTKEERLQAFGQHDHVRVYGRDFIDRLASAGFLVSQVNPLDICSGESIARMRLSNDTIFVCRPADRLRPEAEDRRLNFAESARSGLAAGKIE